jgi:hypothetical protein
LTASGKHEAAAKTGKHLAEAAQERGLVLFHAALRYALAARLLDKDASLPPDQRSVARVHYSNQALALLRKSQAAGFFKDPEQVRLLVQEKHFSALEAHADFRQLLLDLKQPSSDPSQPKVPR